MKLIDKSALVAEIEKRIEEYKSMKIDSSYYDGMIASLEFLHDEFIDTLEVKEVDLEKEIDKWWWGKTWQAYGMVLNSYNIMDFAKHFFELGLKAQKGDK